MWGNSDMGDVRAQLVEHRNHRRYVAGCDECRKRTHTKMVKDRERYKATREYVDGAWVSVHPRCQHGTYSGYIVYACRCEACRTAKNTYTRELRRRKKDQ